MRIDSVHEVDRDGVKVLYYVNVPDLHADKQLRAYQLPNRWNTEEATGLVYQISAPALKQ
jgi:hypothetical protein